MLKMMLINVQEQKGYWFKNKKFNSFDLSKLNFNRLRVDFPKSVFQPIRVSVQLHLILK